MISGSEPFHASAGTNAAVGLRAYLDEVADVVKRVPRAWVRCELHLFKITERFVRMEFIELDHRGTQVAKVQGGCFPAVWRRIQADFSAAGLSLEPGSQVLVQLQGKLDPTFGFQVGVSDIDIKFALGDLNSRIQAIRKQLREAGAWDRNRFLSRPVDFVRVSVIGPPGAASLGDFRSTAARLEAARLVKFEYHEVPFQTRDAPTRIVEELRSIYRASMSDGTRSCAVAIVRGGGASADLAWLVDHKLTEAVCRMNVPVMTGIGHEQDRILLDEVACMSFDTPSKVVEHIVATVTRAALDGKRAYEAIRASAEQMASRTDAAVAALRATVDKDAREAIRAAEVSVRSASVRLEPGARTLLEEAQTLVRSSDVDVDRSARETLRVAESTVRAAAAGLEPGARALLDDVRELAAGQLRSAYIAAGQVREATDQAVRQLGIDIGRYVETATRSVDLGLQRISSELRTRLEAVPESATGKVISAHREIASSVRRAVELAEEEIAGLRVGAVGDATRALDACHSEIAIVQARAETLHPRTVLAAGYVILRDGAGVPLTGVSAVRTAETVTAEMRDGTARLANA